MKLYRHSTPQEIAAAESETKAALCRFSGWAPERVIVKINIVDFPPGQVGWNLNFDIRIDGAELDEEKAKVVDRFFNEAVVEGDNKKATRVLLN